MLKGLCSLEEYKRYRNNLTSTLRAAKLAYFTNFINNHRQNTRAMWQIINQHLWHKSNTNVRGSSIIKYSNNKKYYNY